MLELAEDEQMAFMEEMKKKLLKGKKTSEKPQFIALIGAPGSGKSTLAKQHKNAVVISGDGIIAEYAKALGIDIRDDFYDPEIGKFASKVNNEVLKAAILKGCDVIYDTSAPDNTMKMIDYMAKYGYEAHTKVMLVDEYQAAMNTVERKLDMDDKFTEFRQRKRKTYPDGNACAVAPQVSLNVSAYVAEFVQTAVDKGMDIEVYEFAHKEPSFKTGEDFDAFLENLQGVSDEKNLERAEELKKRASKMGREDDAAWLRNLKKDLVR